MALKSDELVNVWRAQPDSLNAAQWSCLQAWLDAPEQAQAQRFRFAADRCAYVLAHALRRLALAELLGLSAGLASALALRFGHDAAGRPFLADEAGRPVRSPWFFSHAHSREGVLFAATRTHPLGVDLEPLKSAAPEAGLLRRYLDWPAQAGLNGDSPQGFAQGWTALESFLKSLGCGFRGLRSPVQVRCAALTDCAAQPAWRLRLGRQEALVLPIRAPAACVASLALRRAAGAGWPSVQESSFHTDAALLRRLC